MKNIIILSFLLIGLGHATEYQITHIKKGGTLNIREIPVVESTTVVGRVPANATGISIKHCKFNEKGNEWCYINYPLGGYHLEGWVNRYFLKPMKENSLSKRHIQNFLSNFYMADGENFLDKLQVFYMFPMQQYMKKKNLTLMQLRSKKVYYYKKWSKRQYNLQYMKILKRRANYIDVQATIGWKIESADDFQAGKDIQKLRLRPDGNTFKVSAIKVLRHTVYPKPKQLEEQNATRAIIIDINKTVVVKKEPILPKKSTTKKAFYIKTGSFFSPVSSKYLANIKRNGLQYQVRQVKQGKNVIRRVYVGPFATHVAAKSSLLKVRANISKNAYIQSF